MYGLKGVGNSFKSHVGTVRRIDWKQTLLDERRTIILTLLGIIGLVVLQTAGWKDISSKLQSTRPAASLPKFHNLLARLLARFTRICCNVTSSARWCMHPAIYQTGCMLQTLCCSTAPDTGCCVRVSCRGWLAHRYQPAEPLPEQRAHAQPKWTAGQQPRRWRSWW